MRNAIVRTRVTSAAEDEFISYQPQKSAINCTSDCTSQSSSSRRISTSAVQRWLCQSGLHGQIAAKKPLLKDSNNKKRLAWANKHEQLTLDRWKSVIWSDESKFEIFGSNRRVFVRRREGERMISACVVPTVEAWRCDGVGVLCWWQWWVIYNFKHT